MFLVVLIRVGREYWVFILRSFGIDFFLDRFHNFIFFRTFRLGLYNVHFYLIDVIYIHFEAVVFTYENTSSKRPVFV